MPPGSILCPLLFNIFINYLFLFIESTTFCNYADGNTVYYYTDDNTMQMRRQYYVLLNQIH